MSLLANRRALLQQCRSLTCPRVSTQAMMACQPLSRASARVAMAPLLVPSKQHALSHQQRRSVARKARIMDAGYDLLTFLGSTVVMVPLFKKLKISPVLGFLAVGVALHQLGWIRDPKDMEALSELGVLFLLFEMGLELSIDRLKALAKYAFGLGTLQMLLCTAIFSAFALPLGHGVGTQLLEWLAHAPPSLVSIRSIDEAIVIGGALSMSSSAFVLQLLSERGEMPTRFGAATLGVLLLQDIAVVPFLVLLPVAVQLQNSGADPSAMANPQSLAALLGPTALQTVAGLTALLFGGRILLRRVFEVVAASDNSETFVGLCLLTVTGASLLTQKLGFSDTLGAFTAGVLLSESSFKTQVEADIRPFRGLLLGLFFVSTGGSINLEVLRTNWEVITWILAGLITIKTAVISVLGTNFGLSKSEAIRTGFMLSQGGEFAFVLLSLAASLKILPENLNQVLIIVVVLSMALTPGLAELGKVAGTWVEEKLSPVDAGALPPSTSASSNGNGAGAPHSEAVGHSKTAEDAIVILGFGANGQMLATLLESPLSSLPDRGRAYVAFDLDPARVQAGQAEGYNVVYGDGSRVAVLKAAGISRPRAIAVCMTTSTVSAVKTVDSMRTAFPTVPIYAVGAGIREAAELQEAGATEVIMMATAAGLSMGTSILQKAGASMGEVSQVSLTIERAMSERAAMLAERLAKYGVSALDEAEPLVVAQVPETAQVVWQNAQESKKFDPKVEVLPSMEDAMPLKSRVAAAAAAASDLIPSRAVATDVAVAARKEQQVAAKGGAQPASPRASIAQRDAITATATAQLDCGADDELCTPEDVASLLRIDASKQQARSDPDTPSSSSKSSSSGRSVSSVDGDSQALSSGSSVDGGEGEPQYERRSGGVTVRVASPEVVSVSASGRGASDESSLN